MLADLLIKIAGMTAKPEAEYRPRPSSAGPERCLRQLVYKALGTPGKPTGDRFIMVLDDSSWPEELTADWIRKSAFQPPDQQPVVGVEGAVVRDELLDAPDRDMRDRDPVADERVLARA